MDDSQYAQIIDVDGLDLEVHFRYLNAYRGDCMLIVDALTLVGDKRNIIDHISGGVLDLAYAKLEEMPPHKLMAREAPTGVEY
jgi:hypothetical protein